MSSFTDTQKGPGPWDHLRIGDPSGTQLAHEPFAIPNGRAFQTYQRTSYNWIGSTVYLGGETSQQGPVKLVDRQPGRDWLILFVPTTAPAAVLLGSTDSALESAGSSPTTMQGFLLPIGGNMTLPTEGPVWALSATTGTTTYICVASGVNPL